MKVLLLLLALARAAPDDAPEPGPDEPQPEPVETPDEPALTPEEPVEEPVETPPEPPADAPQPFATALDAAKRRYFEGEHEDALRQFEALRDRLDTGEDVPEALVEDALSYLGEVQFQLGDKPASWATFEDLLHRVPEADLSPVEHPPEVVRWFELVREKVQQDQVVPEPVPPPPMLPAWGYLPFGVPQFVMGRNGRGAAYLTLQAGFAAVSIWSYVHLTRINGENHPPEWTDEEVSQHVNLERWALQWPATLGFYALWTVSVFDARRTWRLDHPMPESIGLEPRPGGATLVVRGRL